MTRLPPISTLFPYTTLFRSQLELFPSDHRLLDEDRVHRTQVETTLNDALEFLRVESQPAACAAQRKGGTNHAREPDALNHALAFTNIADDFTARSRKADLGHCLFEKEAVFGHVHRFGLRADHLDFVFIENAALGELDGDIQGRLAANRGQQRVRSFAFDDGCDKRGRERFNVGAIRDFRVGHDRRGIRIHKNDFVTLFAQRLAGLRSGVIEFTRLPDDNWTGTDDEDFLDVSALWHSASTQRIS